MSQDLNQKFLISRFVESEDLKTNFKINFTRFNIKEYYKLSTEESVFYEFYICKYGKVIIGSTAVGICYLHFVDDEILAEKAFKSLFFDCNILKQKEKLHQTVLKIMDENKWPDMLTLQVKGTDFQYKVWRGLTKIALGQIITYSELAKNIGVEGSARAVGTAIGCNEIAFLIPCHRVVQKTGKLAGFRWGDDVKYKLLQNELTV